MGESWGDTRMAEFRENYVPSWKDDHGPYLRVVDDPFIVMCRKRLARNAIDNKYHHPINHPRLDALAAPRNYVYDGMKSVEAPPVANWCSTSVTKEQWHEIEQGHLAETGNHGPYVLRVKDAWDDMDPTLEHYLQESNAMIPINPPRVSHLTNNKQFTAHHLREYDLPAVPSVSQAAALDMDRETFAATMGNAEYVVKPCTSRAGNGVEALDTYEDVCSYLEETDDPHTVQPKIPHRSDLRVMVVGDTVVNAERRIADEEDFRTNLSLLSSEVADQYLSTGGKLYNALREERVEHINVDLYETVPEAVAAQEPRVLSPGVKTLAEDIVATLNPETFAYDETLPTKPFFLGLDILEVDQADAGLLPTDLYERAEPYSDGDTIPLIMELNDGGGTIVDHLAMLEHPEQNTFYHLTNLMRELSGEQPYNLETVVNDLTHPLHSRADTFFSPPHEILNTEPEQLVRDHQAWIAEWGYEDVIHPNVTDALKAW